ncbi:AMP-binding protein [Streptomyces sedi]|uniref:AMP-binding protein n=1 Tax=Streptomyces sedi TaxID=555059 RepID=A0A5C4V9S0_9ACTN|nr:class I adenylate-forming enzyme family protein [Streptomyces sedi]TNM32246.1 AMP-binding protein [Streptomyces sedi]
MSRGHEPTTATERSERDEGRPKPGVERSDSAVERSETLGERPELAELVLEGRSRVDGGALGPHVVGAAEAALRRAGVRPGAIVLLTGLDAVEALGGMVAAWRLDAVPLVAPATRRLPREAHGVCRLGPSAQALPATDAAPVAGLERTAVLMPTSGSTGEPKLVRRGVASVLAEAEGYREHLALTSADRVAVPVPLTHSYGWGVAMSALLTGCALDTTPPARARTLARLMDTGAVSVVALTAALARLLVEVRRDGARRVRLALVGAGGVSDALDTAFAARFGRRLHRGYGSTETGGVFLGREGIGRPVAGVRVRRPARGATGELVLETPAPVEGVLGAEPTGLWHTGDLVRRDPDGVCHHLERLRPGLRLNDRFVDTAELTGALGALRGVTDVQPLVLPRSGTPEFEDLYVVVESLSPLGEDDWERVMSALPESLPRPCVLRCEALPRDVLGKLDRDALVTWIRDKEKRGGKRAR